jgi:hypothetical protein
LLHRLKFRILKVPLAVCRLAPEARTPAWALHGKFLCVTRTADELSIVCSAGSVPQGVIAERDWIALKLEGPFPFSMTGVLASFLQPLAQAKVSIFAVSTFDTDYILIKQKDLEHAVEALCAAGHEKIENESL